MNDNFTYTLEAWYASHGRQLPWRQTRDPYCIWLSEVILQQTQVAQGMAYYSRFLSRFPDAQSLADASEDEVMLLWQGLGYYSRARNLHAAAKQIAQAGAFPNDYDSIRRLKGVGDYTAAAIASIAFGLPYAVLDGNVYRVLARYFGLQTPIDTTAGHKAFRMLADEMLDRRNPALYNQAIMDFGALQCTPRSPRCQVCPLADSCQALAAGLVDSLPCKSRRTRVIDRYFTYLYICSPDGQLLIQRRGAGDIWQGLYQLPLIETPSLLAPQELVSRFPGCKAELLVDGITHQLTHQLLHAQCFALPSMSYAKTVSGGLWVPLQNLQDYAMPQLLVRIIRKISR
ncbi:MAG: A/G-specific adenine glycosylase [Bacteroidaceae bacterium]|nr:A/G-specific adenine glycosylase [Bacteroidaceae bacterium]